MSRGLRRLACLFAAMVMALAGGAGTALAQPPGGAVLRVAVTQEIDSLNPFVAVFLTSTQVNRLMYEYLTTAGPDNSAQPALAESWQAAPDKLTWTFRIREANWSDGKPITAKDVAFTYNQIMTNDAAKEANGGAVENYASVTATDDRTLVIVTKQPMASILNSEIPIVPEHIWASQVDRIGTLTNTETFPVVGSGPYVLTGYQEGQSVTLQANDSYWRGRPKADGVQLVKYENTDAAVQGLRKGDIDLVRDTTPAQFDSLAGDPNITRNEGRNRRFTELLMNWSNPSGVDGKPFGDGNPALKDVRVRRALHHAIDVNAVVERIKQGHSEPGYSIIPPVYPDWTFTPAPGQRRDFDPEKAKALLDEAGYRAGPDGKRVGPDGKPLALRLVSSTDVATNRQLADFMVGWFNQIGVTLTPTFKSSNQADDDMSAGNFDLAFSGWSVNPDPDPMLHQQTCSYNATAQSDSGYCNPEYDRLYAAQQAELDKPKRQEIVKQMNSLLYDDVHAVVLTHDRLLEAYRSDRFTGFVTQPAEGGVITGQTGYWGYYNATPVATQANTGGGNPAGIIAAVIGGVIVLGLVAFFVVRGRRSSSDERE